MFEVFAPPVLAADGDVAREDASLARPGLLAAKAHYDDCLRELHRHERASAAGALNDALRRAARYTFALALAS